MKTTYLLLLFIACSISNSLFAGQQKHIQVVVKSGGNNEIIECIQPDKNGKITLGGGPFYVVAHNYASALGEHGCDPLKYIIRDANDPTIIYASTTLTVDMIVPLEEDPESILCVETYSIFQPTISFRIAAPCGPDNEGTIELEMVVDYNFDSACAEIFFPKECYPDDGHDHLVYEHTVRRTIKYTCCDEQAPDPPADPSGGLKKAAPTQDQYSVIQVAPNPFTASFNIEIASIKEESAQIDIFDGNSRMVYTQQEDLQIGINEYLIDGAAFSNGFYYVRIKTREKTEIRRIVKMQ